MGYEDFAWRDKLEEGDILSTALELTGVPKLSVDDEDEWKPIGKGSFGNVYSNGVVAVKKIPLFVEDEGTYDSSLLEIVALSRTKSNYVINIVGATFQNDAFYIGLELGVSNLLGYYQITRREILIMVKAVRFLHSKDVIHMDIKPTNFLLMGDGRIVLGDMGTCILYPETKPYTTVGTQQYWDPEMLQYIYELKTASDMNDWGRKISAPSDHNYFGMDVWSLGCTLAELLNKQMVLFRGEKPKDILDAIDVKLPTLTCGEYTEMINRMLEPHHMKRCTMDDVFSYF